MKLLHNYVSALRFGAKLLPSEILNSGLLTFGKVFWVNSDTGADSGKGDSPAAPYKTLAYAYAQTTNNNNDVILLAAGSAHTLTSMLTISNNKVHFIGTGFGARTYGQRARVNMGVTAATTDVHMIKNLGTGNSFINIKFANDNTVAQNTSCFGEGGQYSLFDSCEFYDSTNLDSDSHAELLLNGDSPQFLNCTFGSTADAVSGNKVRPAVITTGGGVASAYSGGVTRDALFDGCHFYKNAGGTGTAMVKVTADNDLERMFEIRNCVFSANKLGSVPAVAIASAASLTKSQIQLTGNTVAFNCTKVGTATGIINGTPAYVATATIGVQAT